MTKLTLSGAAVVAVWTLFIRAAVSGAQTVTYERNQAGHWVVVQSEPDSAARPVAHDNSALGYLATKTGSAASPNTTRTSGIAAEAGHVAAPAASTSTGPATGVAVAAIVPPTPAASPASSPALPAYARPQVSPSAAALPSTSKPLSQSSPAATPIGHYPGALSDGERLFYETRDDSFLNPNNWAVHVYKSRHLLEVYYKGHLYKTYHAVFGRSRWVGAKEWEGDLRTPEGDYLIIAKRPSRRFRWFLALNYPNAIDQARFEHLRAVGEIPRNAREGGQIGIHGTEIPLLNIGDINWTTGCISVDNMDISELARLLPVGTLVVINP